MQRRQKILGVLAASCLVLAMQTATAADDTSAAPLPIEQQLYNDFAARLQEHLHHTAQILDKIRQSKDAQERQKLMKDYEKAMQTTHKVHQAMTTLMGTGGGGMMGGMMMAGKKMGGMGGGCMMMRKQSASAGAAAAASGAQDADAAGDTATGDDAAEGQGDAGEHEGHH
jgi:hypothetical protein